MICDGPLSRAQQLKGQLMMHKFNLLNGFSYMCLGDTVIILFAVKLACPNSMIAILGAMAQFAFLMMPLGKMITARIGAARSQGTFWVCRNIAALIVASAALWEYFNLHQTAQWAILLGAFFFYGFRAAGAIMAKPLAGCLTEEWERASYFAKNTAAFHITNLTALILVSIILRYTDSIWTLTCIIISGSMVGITSSRYLRQVDETRAIRDAARRPIWQNLGHAWRNSHFRSLQYAQVGFAATAIMLIPMSLLTLKRGCHVSDTGALLYTLVLFAAATVMSYFTGKVINRFGVRKVIILCQACRLLIPWFWILMPEPFLPGLAAIPFLLSGMSGVGSNATAQYFLRALPVQSQVIGSILSALIGEALAGFVGMLCASGLMKLAEHLAQGSTSGFLLYRIYFMLAFMVCATLCFYPVLKLKRFVEKKA
ncbi:MAG: hypothetical protein IJC34_08240 [Lentisphaeria bacterium]|nr:hypothetical protein [Lentisphaeria bacterium]